jgi:hypothetical protein
MNEIIKKEDNNIALPDADFLEIEKFTINNLNAAPIRIEKAPDGSDEIPISYIESMLDSIYMRLWGTENVSFSVVANEICCDLTLWVIDPQHKIKITRCGTASLAIMMDKVPDGLNGKDRNIWALSMENKKPFALKLQRPAVKQLAIKNAAKSLGISFGRNLNRKHVDAPDEFYGDQLRSGEMLHESFKMLKNVSSVEDFQIIWETFEELHNNDEFKKEFMYRRRLFDSKSKSK